MCNTPLEGDDAKKIARKPPEVSTPVWLATGTKPLRRRGGEAGMRQWQGRAQDAQAFIDSGEGTLRSFLLSQGLSPSQTELALEEAFGATNTADGAECKRANRSNASVAGDVPQLKSPPAAVEMAAQKPPKNCYLPTQPLSATDFVLDRPRPSRRAVSSESRCEVARSRSPIGSNGK